MLQLRPNCECCNCDLPASSDQAMICTFECTFCSDCAEHNFKGTCPNCGGNFATRPVRPVDKLVKFPAAAERFLRNHAGCKAA